MTWIDDVLNTIEKFTKKHGVSYRATHRQLSASFEIGCFHGLIDFYESIGYSLTLENLIDGKYRYLTTPAGNPVNFSYVTIAKDSQTFQIRQQVKIRSHTGEDIAFSPDFSVLKSKAKINATKDPDFANGKKSFFTVSSSDVVAAHECKSTSVYPELMVYFIGMLVTAHRWFDINSGSNIDPRCDNGKHLAPTLFVGALAKNLDLRMLSSLEKVYPINIITGLHHDIHKVKLASRNRISPIMD